LQRYRTLDLGFWDFQIKSAAQICANRAIAAIKNLMKNCKVTDIVAQTNKENEINSPQPSKKLRVDFGDKLQEQIDAKSRQMSSVDNELVGYLELSNMPVKKTDVYQWWSSKKGSYPMLFQMASKYLCIPAPALHRNVCFLSLGMF
jgi:hypothetical protein